MTTQYNKTERSGERGNVLFLILIAVALFAALSYAVTQSSRSGGGDANSEKSLVSSSQLTQYPAGVRTSIVRMIVSNGVSIDELIFDDPSDFADVEAASLESKAVFYPSGGGATYAQGPADVMKNGTSAPWIFTSRYQVKNIGITDDADNIANEIIAFLPGVSRAVCTKINAQLGITTATATPPDGDFAAPVAADAMTLNAPGAVGIGAASSARRIGETATEFLGQPFGCFHVAGTVAPNDVYVYYHVLVER